MKIPSSRSLPWFAMVCSGLPWFGKQSQTNANYRKPLSTARRAPGYTLIEVLAAAAIVSIGATAMVSLSSTLMLQEEFSTRVAITRNYQENMARLWQLGVSPVQVTALMPAQTQNATLQVAVYGTPSITETGITTVNGVVMDTAECRASVNISQDPTKEEEGAAFTITAYRPRLITELRTPRP